MKQTTTLDSGEIVQASMYDADGNVTQWEAIPKPPTISDFEKAAFPSSPETCDDDSDRVYFQPSMEWIPSKVIYYDPADLVDGETHYFIDREAWRKAGYEWKVRK